MCAGVQKVSRPMASCQEMSHSLPTTAQMTDKTAHQMYQGMESVAVETCSALEDWIRDSREMVPAILRNSRPGNFRARFPFLNPAYREFTPISSFAAI